MTTYVLFAIAIFLLFLTGVGPLLAWRKASTNSLKRNFMVPAVIALILNRYIVSGLLAGSVK